MVGHDLVAVDVGNARIKLGLFEGDCAARAAGLPEPVGILPLVGDSPDFDRIGPWLGEKSSGVLSWRIASVNRSAASRLIDWIERNRPGDGVTLLAAGDLPLRVSLERPDMVGIDRLVDAVAANRLRGAGRPAVIVDVGTAITVDFVSGDGVFRGGSILPGIGMSARALFEFTDLLPMIDVSELGAPPMALGTDTESAMRSGLFWGAVGSIRQLIDEFCRPTGGGVGENERPEVFLTGGAAVAVAELIGVDARYVPNLTLAGIALSC